MDELYSCAGYVLDRNENTCDVCFIYDVTTPLFTVNRSQGSASCVRDIHKENNGRIVYQTCIDTNSKQIIRRIVEENV